MVTLLVRVLKQKRASSQGAEKIRRYDGQLAKKHGESSSIHRAARTRSAYQAALVPMSPQDPAQDRQDFP